MFPIATFLYHAAPICLTARVFFAPSMWKNARKYGILGLLAPTTLVWAALFFIPFSIAGYFSMEPFGLPNANGPEIVSDWPETCRMKHPKGYGLFVTRTLALFGAHLCEGLWNLWIVLFHSKTSWRVCGLAIPMVIISLFMLLGGPYNFMTQVEERSTCDFMWVPINYFLWTGVAVVIGVLLLFSSFGLPSAVTKPLKTTWGPYSHWSTWFLLFVLVAQLQVLRHTITTAGDGYKGACGVKNVTYYFPRHWGLIFYDWGQLLILNLWILGNFLWNGALNTNAAYTTLAHGTATRLDPADHSYLSPRELQTRAHETGTRESTTHLFLSCLPCTRAPASSTRRFESGGTFGSSAYAA